MNLNSDEVSACSEEMIRFLSEVEADEESANLLLGFCFFRVRFEAQNVKRKMNPMFGSVDAGDKSRKYSGDESLKGSRPMFLHGDQRLRSYQIQDGNSVMKLYSKS